MEQNPQLILPIEAQNKFEKVADENHQLHLLLDSQNIILDELQNDPNFDEDKILDSINSVNKEIEETDLLLQKAQFALNDILLNRQQNDQKESPSEILKIILPRFQSLIFEICKNVVDNGQTNASLLMIYELEQKVIKIIDSLRQKGVYPESEADFRKYFEDMQNHHARIHAFIQDVLKGEPGEQQ
ncbi:hypothetical protein TRFO_37176 [Tritrichomonas foetus]|uniref:Uncharacterized protein n=1 Tax=Tritrichomonas foetus TaxID=1144522 RepID=A0A1J4JG53_9EUKA|nr:hypothetical protein TRFO_37176 [Tritrichomonas foetus]|eukprot:OHS96627.1 hypothetical protein TRFO_37176 [Tritrichomonas foetus]